MAEHTKTPTSRSLKAAELRQQFWNKQSKRRTPNKFQYDDNNDTENLRIAREYEASHQGATQKLGEVATVVAQEPVEPSEEELATRAPEKEAPGEFLAHTFEAAQKLTREWSDEEIDGIYGQYAVFGSKLHFDTLEPSAADQTFNENSDTLGKKYGEDLDALKMKYAKVVKNKDGSERTNVQNNSLVFWQFDSDECVKRRANGEQVAVDKRIYLNPKRTEAVRIYEELIHQVDVQRLACRSKILDARYGGKSSLTNERGDAIVLYGGNDNADALLAIVESIYEANRDAFVGQDVAHMPLRIADGVAVGSEPKGLSGIESLTSHRAKIIDMTVNALHQKAQAQNIDLDADPARRNKNFRKLLREAFKANNVNPDNWAFDLK